MKKQIITALAAVAVVAAGCENDMTYRGEVRDPKMRLSAIFGPSPGNTPHTIHVGETVSVWGDHAPREVTDATLRVLRNGKELTVEPFETSTGIHLPYTFVTDMVAGDRFEFVGSSPLHGAVSASTVVPRPADITGIKIEPFFGGDNPSTPAREGNGMPYVRALVTIADPPGERNYYRVEIYSVTHYIRKYTKWAPVTGDPVTVIERYNEDQLCTLITNDEILYQDINGNPTGIDSWGQFSDELIDGREYTLNVYVQTSHGRGYGLDYVPAEHLEGIFTLGESVRVEVHTLSPELFGYLRYVDMMDVYSALTEPLQIFSNVAGGHGIFGAYNVAHKTFYLEPREEDVWVDYVSKRPN